MEEQGSSRYYGRLRRQKTLSSWKISQETEVFWLFFDLWYNRCNLEVWSRILRKSFRVKSEKDFKAIFEASQSVANRKFVVYRLEKQQKHYRVGLSVGKKLGNAVVRNRIKRRLRHLVMEFSPYLVTDDFVVIARKGVEELSYQELRQNLMHVLKLGNLYQEGLSSEKED